MTAAVYTTAGGRRFHADLACRALATGRETAGYLAFERGHGYDDRRPLHVLRQRSNLAAALLGYTACRVCVPPAHALPATGQTYGHEPVGVVGGQSVCARCGTDGPWGGGYAVPWPCTSALVLGLVPRGGA